MLNLERMITSAAEAAGDKPIVAAPYPLPKVLCDDLISRGVISGYVADTTNNLAARDPHIAGWWVDHATGIWFLRRRKAHSIILLSVVSHGNVSGRMLLQARLKGWKHLLLVDPDGLIVRKINTASGLLRRLRSPAVGKDLYSTSYESAFEEMYSLVGDKLRLPDADFDPERVLIVAGTLRAGGAERQATYTACGLAKRWPGRVHVAFNSVEGVTDFYKPVLDAARISTHPIVSSASGDPEYSSPDMINVRNQLAARYAPIGFLNVFHAIFHQALLIRSIRPGLVHCFQDYSNVLAGIAADLVGVPRLVLGGRSMAPDHFGIFQPYMAPGYRALLRRRKIGFLNNSEAGAQDYARWLGIQRNQLRVIQNGFEFPEEQAGAGAAERKALGIPENAVLVGSIVGFREEKQPKLFLEMARALHASHPDVHFVIYGEGILLPDCRAFVELKNLSGVVHLPGLTEHAWRALSAMDVFVLTSRLEGLPNVMIEAQAMGLPVVSSGAGGMRETFIEGETGFGVPSATTEGLAAAVGRLIVGKELRNRMGAAARRHARQTFNIDRMIDRTIEAYAGVQQG